MNKRSRLVGLFFVVVLIGTVIPAGNAERPAQALEVRTEPMQHAVLAAPPQPMPHDCDGVTPTDEDPPACCIYGYVFYDGEPVGGAAVTVQGPGGSQAVTTGSGGLSDEPYFATSLSDDPIAASVSDTITLSVSYGGSSRVLTYQVVEAGQQVDLVLPTNTSDTPIYYVSGAESNREIGRMNGDGTNRTYVRPGWDPDICSTNGHVLFVDDEDIHVMDINGTYIANLTLEGSPPGNYPSYNPDWSPDCSQIVYAAAYPSWQYTLVVMNADGSGKRVLLAPSGTADDWYPEWSPNGEWIVFTSTRSGDPNGDVYRVNVDGSDLRPLTTERGWFPVWSPDSSRIAYVGFTDLVQDIWVMNADGSDQHRLTYEPQAWWPYWLSDGRLMYVTGDNVHNGTHLDIFTINADGTNKQNLTNDGNSYYRSPTVRPVFPPIATIHSIVPGCALQGRDVVTFRGSGQDADENGGAVVAYHWRSSMDGLLSTQAEFSLPASDLSLGTHTVYLQVQDDEGDWSFEVWQLLVVTDQPFDMDVLIVTNRERLAALHGESHTNQVMQKLDELALKTNGLVLQVEEDATVAAAYSAWLANPTSFAHANAVADAIHDLIVAQLGTSPDLANIVIVGDDRVVPFRRVQDRTRHPEHHYDLVPSDTTTGAALAAGRTLTDDFYGDRVPTIPRRPGWGSRPLYIPDMAVGRLVETPVEIIGQIDEFLTGDEIEVGEAIVTGYDFLVDSAQEICSALIADDLFPDCGLIGSNWTASQFISQVLEQRHDLVSFSGHANHHTIGTPHGSVSSSQVRDSSVDHGGTLFWSPGCHGALNVPPETDVSLDTTQALMGRGALVMGNTGYGWGYLFAIGLSEQLMLNYTRHLVAGGETSVGQALVAAKQQYYLEELEFDEYDEKILIEATLYGIPMTRVTSFDESGVAVTAQASRTSTSEPGGGLTVDHVHYDFPELIAETMPQGTLFSCGGQVECSNGTPIQPRYHDPLSSAAGEPHGAVLRGASGQELPGFDPVVDEAVWEIGSGGSEPVFDTPSWFPGTILQLNDAGGQHQLVIGLGQFHGESETQRLYGAMDVDVYLGQSDDWEPPLLRRIESGLQEGVVTVTVGVKDLSGIHGVVLAYTSGDGDWSSVALVADDGDGSWSGDFLGDAATEFFVQAVDTAGNVALHTQNGQYLRPGDTYWFSQVFLPLVTRRE